MVGPAAKRAAVAHLEAKMGLSLGGLRLISSAGAFCDAAARDDVQKFAAEHNVPAKSRSLRRTLERINRAWLCVEAGLARARRSARVPPAATLPAQVAPASRRLSRGGLARALLFLSDMPRAPASVPPCPLWLNGTR